MQPGFSNGQRHWLSSEGNAIWYSTAVVWSIGLSENSWKIGNSDDLGSTAFVPLFLPIKDPGKECPHDDDLKSNWIYFKDNGDFVHDVSNSVRIHCLKGTKRNLELRSLHSKLVVLCFQLLEKFSSSKVNF